jgi:hypothetical protein
MTTLAQGQKHNKPAVLAGFLLLTVIAAFFALTILWNGRTSTFAAVKPIPQIKYQPHAVEKHGSDALAIRKCLNDKGGADQIWRSFDKKTFYLWCELPDGRWGFMAIVRDVIDRLWYESTSFVKGDGTMGTLLRYMEKFGTRFNGPYPWGT